MKTSKDLRQTSAACVSCGLKISSRASGHASRICLICYARLLNDHFQKGRSEKAQVSGLSK